MATCSIRDPARWLSWALAVAVVTAGAAACRVERTHDPGDGVHASGFADPKSADFHGTYLASHGFPLGDCRDCHGGDYTGGLVGVSCVDAGCHTKGVEACTTCHAAPPLTGAHPGHAFDCAGCHPAHTDARSFNHPDGQVELPFTGLASSKGSHPSFDAATQTCADVYCHGGRAMTWTEQGPLGCDGCHDNPPASHTQFATSASDCTTCHGGAPVHLDGNLDVAELGCNACHGKGPLGAPPPGLHGATSSPAIGAHARHLDATLADRIGRVARCDDCHVVPTETSATGHIDASAPADVTLHGDETYDGSTRGCVVGCHWDRDPGPRWDDASGAARACDACHAFPPTVTRTGTAHPPAPPDLAVCVTCHTFDPATHVDGTVDF